MRDFLAIDPYDGGGDLEFRDIQICVTRENYISDFAFRSDGFDSADHEFGLVIIYLLIVCYQKRVVPDNLFLKRDDPFRALMFPYADIAACELYILNGLWDIEFETTQRRSADVIRNGRASIYNSITN